MSFNTWLRSGQKRCGLGAYARGGREIRIGARQQLVRQTNGGLQKRQGDGLGSPHRCCMRMFLTISAQRLWEVK